MMMVLNMIESSEHAKKASRVCGLKYIHWHCIGLAAIYERTKSVRRSLKQQSFSQKGNPILHLTYIFEMNIGLVICKYG